MNQFIKHGENRSNKLIALALLRVLYRETPPHVPTLHLNVEKGTDDRDNNPFRRKLNDPRKKKLGSIATMVIQWHDQRRRRILIGANQHAVRVGLDGKAHIRTPLRFHPLPHITTILHLIHKRTQAQQKRRWLLRLLTLLSTNKREVPASQEDPTHIAKCHAPWFVNPQYSNDRESAQPQSAPCQKKPHLRLHESTKSSRSLCQLRDTHAQVDRSRWKAHSSLKAGLIQKETKTTAIRCLSQHHPLVAFFQSIITSHRKWNAPKKDNAMAKTGLPFSF